MIHIQLSASSKKVMHKDTDTGIVTDISGLPPHASLKAILARAKALGLKVR